MFFRRPSLDISLAFFLPFFTCLALSTFFSLPAQHNTQRPRTSLVYRLSTSFGARLNTVCLSRSLTAPTSSLSSTSPSSADLLAFQSFLFRLLSPPTAFLSFCFCWSGGSAACLPPRWPRYSAAYVFPAGSLLSDFRARNRLHRYRCTFAALQRDRGCICCTTHPLETGKIIATAKPNCHEGLNQEGKISTGQPQDRQLPSHSFMQQKGTTF